MAKRQPDLFAEDEPEEESPLSSDDAALAKQHAADLKQVLDQLDAAHYRAKQTEERLRGLTAAALAACYSHEQMAGTNYGQARYDEKDPEHLAMATLFGAIAAYGLFPAKEVK